jgi:GTPase
MTKRYMRAVAAIAVPVCLAAAPLAAADKQNFQRILQEVQALKKTYENRIATLENKLKVLEKKGKRS